MAVEAGVELIVGDSYFCPNFLSLDQPHNHKPYLYGHIFFLGWCNKANWSINLLVFSWHPREGNWYFLWFGLSELIGCYLICTSCWRLPPYPQHTFTTPKQKASSKGLWTRFLRELRPRELSILSLQNLGTTPTHFISQYPLEPGASMEKTQVTSISTSLTLDRKMNTHSRGLIWGGKLTPILNTVRLFFGTVRKPDRLPREASGGIRRIWERMQHKPC